ILHGKEITGIEGIVANELEEVAMKYVRAGLHHGIDGGSRMHSVGCILCTGHESKFLESIRKRKGEARTVERVYVWSAVQRILNAEVIPAGDRYSNSRPHAVTWRCAGLNRQAG